MNARHWKCCVPAGVQGRVVIETFTVSAADAAMSAVRRSYVPDGEYTRLTIGGNLVMSDTPKERCDHNPLFWKATGHVLLNGLGLGCCLNVVLNTDGVRRVTVIEKNRDVIDLVGPHFPEAEIICDDAFDWKPPRGVRYGAVWHDIWSNMCIDNLTEMHRLHRKYGRRTDWQGSWSRGFLEDEQRRQRRIWY